MKFSFFKKIIPVIIIASFILGNGEFIGAPRAVAALPSGTTSGTSPSTPGAAIGQALAKGALCFFESKLEIFAAGLIEKMTFGLVEARENLALFPEGVPSNDISAPGETAKMETATAVDMSKKCIRDVVVKMLIDWMVDSTVQWIQNGGEPQYVTNWDSFAQDAFNVGVGEIINGTNLAFLCKPFSLQVRLALQAPPRFQSRITCTLDDIVANIEDFYNDFNNGGWLAYEQSWYPENNFYGATLMAANEATARGEQQQQAALNEGVANNGMLSIKECQNNILTLDKSYDPTPYLQEGYKKDIKGNYCMPQDMATVTPGALVGEVTGKALTSDTEWAANVQSWTAAIVDAAIGRLFKEGLSSMKKSTSGGGFGSSSNYNPYGGYNPNASLEAQARDDIVNNYQNFLPYFNAVAASKTQSLSSENQILTHLYELRQRNCQPTVTDSEITIAQNEITRLTNELNYYQTAINQLNSNIAAAENIQNFTDREIALLSQNYTNFANNYQFLIEEITADLNATPTTPATDNTKKLAQDETQAKLNELSATQSRLNLCLTIQHTP